MCPAVKTEHRLYIETSCMLQFCTSHLCKLNTGPNLSCQMVTWNNKGNPLTLFGKGQALKKQQPKNQKYLSITSKLLSVITPNLCL